jgi:imidazolonepropionase-like amidohydrolase
VRWIEGRNRAVGIEGATVAAEEARSAPTGEYIVPAFVDAHVHLTVAGDVAAAEVRGGVAAVLDLGAPEASLPLQAGPLRVFSSGPLLTAPGGYPTQSWGAGGHGLAVA